MWKLSNRRSFSLVGFSLVMVIQNTLAAPNLLEFEPDGKSPVTFVPILVDDISFVPQESPFLPLDPGEQGKSSLSGADVDRDGVRDDVERYIAYSFPNSPEIRAPLYLNARALQKMVIEGGVYPNQTLKLLLDSSACIQQIPGLAEEQKESYEDEVLARMMNTYNRSVAYAINSQNALVYIDELDGACY